MRSLLLWLFVVVSCGCQTWQAPITSPPDESSSVVRLTNPADYQRHVGLRVEVVGVVTNTKCPQVCGIDVWSLDAHRGRSLKIRGTLRETVVTQESLDTAPVIANRGAGRFYSLDDMEFVVFP